MDLYCFYSDIVATIAHILAVINRKTLHDRHFTHQRSVCVGGISLGKRTVNGLVGRLSRYVIAGMERDVVYSRIMRGLEGTCGIRRVFCVENTTDIRHRRIVRHVHVCAPFVLCPVKQHAFLVLHCRSRHFLINTNPFLTEGNVAENRKLRLILVIIV